MQANFPIDNGLSKVLGFRDNILLEASKDHNGEKLVDIFNVNTVRVQCNIVKGALVNGKRSKTIFQFYQGVEPGEKIALTPNPVIYQRVHVNRLDVISLNFVDQKNRPINFRGENISVQLHLKRI